MSVIKLSRRHILTSTGLSSGIAVLGLGFGQISMAKANEQESKPETSPGKRTPWYELGMMEDAILDQVLLYYLGHTWQRLADVGECLETANRIKIGDPWSWSKEWKKTAVRLQTMARESEDEKHFISAGEAYLRSSNYYIASLHRHPDPSDYSVQEMTLAAIQCFRKGVKYLEMPVQEVQIPYEDTTLPGYFYRSPIADGKAPTLIIFQGRDGWAIQDKMLAEAGNKRGYHVMLFDGPGQGPVLRLQGLPFRYDWEKVVTAVIDYTLKINGVDPDRIGVMGLSMGGVLAPRAAAFEHRPKVYIASPGVISWSDIMEDFIGQITGEEALGLIDSDPSAFNDLMYSLMETIPVLKWGMEDFYWKRGVSTPVEVMVDVRKYDNSETLGKIEGKMLLMDGAADDWTQAVAMQKLLKGKADLITFAQDDPGLVHCQTAALALLNHRLFNWLDDNLMI